MTTPRIGPGWRRALSRGLLACLGAVLVLAPAFALTDGYRLDIGTMALYLAGLTATWSLLAGIAGQFSFAHVAIAGLGGYASAIWSQRLQATSGVLASAWLAIVFGVVCAALLGTLLGLLVDRLRGAYLALFTIAFAVIAQIFVVAESELTGGAFSLPVDELPGSEVAHFEAMLALLLVLLAASYRLLRSSSGTLMRAVRDDEDAAAAMGVNVRRLKLGVFSATAAAVGLAAGVYYHTTPRIGPDSVGLLEMSEVVAFAVIGGIESPLAGAVAAIVFTFLLEYLRAIDLGPAAVLALGLIVVSGGLAAAALGFHRRRAAGTAAGVVVAAAGGWFASLGRVQVDLSVWRLAAFGAVLVLAIRFMPNGLLTPLLDRLGGREAAVRAAATLRSERAPSASVPPRAPATAGHEGGGGR